mmetsp:Transcript_93823/g.201441  ORF Transcript_93823/g.201441 Transcript_93823/m.201441 type:complete len:629 (-) Transcript_93823:73-1959(-)
MPWTSKAWSHGPSAGQGGEAAESKRDHISEMRARFVDRTFVRDQELPESVSVKSLPPSATGFPAWQKRSRDGRMRDRGWAEWLVPSDVGNSAPRVLYFHGGGYEHLSPPQVRPTTARLAALLGMPVFCIDYRKIPEHPHPAQLDDARQALEWIWEHGPHGAAKATAVFCAGDSAGGGLALGLAVYVRDMQPTCCRIDGIVTVSPMTDLTCSGESYMSRRWKQDGGDHCDPLFRGRDPAADSMPQIYRLFRARDGMHRSFELTTPYISPLHAELHDLPATLIQVGDAEVMLSDSVDFAKKARAAGSQVSLHVFPRMWHCFHRFSEGCGTGVPLEEGTQALKEQAAFLRQLVGGAAHKQSSASAPVPASTLRADGHVQLQQTLQQHLGQNLVKGWEADRRTCLGEQRRPLIRAAKAALAASDIWHAGPNSAAMQHSYLAKIRTLLHELQKAGESDFDGLLKEALVCLKGAPVLAAGMPVLDGEDAAALDRIWQHRFGGVGRYKGRACDRDTRRAAMLAEEVRKSLCAFEVPSDLESGKTRRLAYIAAVDALRAEIFEVGEIDFDGLLRQAVRVLETNAVCKSADAKEAQVAVKESADAATGRSSRRWRAKGQHGTSQGSVYQPASRVMGA